MKMFPKMFKDNGIFYTHKKILQINLIHFSLKLDLNYQVKYNHLPTNLTKHL